MSTLLERIQRYDEDRAFLRQAMIPEEDRHRFTSVKWSGEYRWFRSPNVICLEKARAVRTENDGAELRVAGVWNHAAGPSWKADQRQYAQGARTASAAARAFTIKMLRCCGPSTNCNSRWR
jgi:hypothetical protein